MSRTRETLTFAPVTLPVFAGADQAEVPGVYFLARSSDRESGRVVSAGSGTWLNVPGVKGLMVSAAILRLAQSLGGEEEIAAGTHHVVHGPPSIGPASAVPVDVSTGRMVTDPGFLDVYDTVALPAGVPREALSDPAVMLRGPDEDRVDGRTSVLRVSTDADLGRLLRELDGALAPVQNTPGVSAQLTMWLETRETEGRAAGPWRLRFCSRRLTTDGAFAWPEVRVGTLGRR